MKPIILPVVAAFLLAACHAATGPLAKMKAGDFFSAGAEVALAEAAARGQVGKVQELLDRGTDVNSRGKDGMTPLLWTLLQENRAGFKYLLEHGANANLPAKKGTSVMSFAAMHKDSTFLALALKNGGNPNLVGTDLAQTPIFVGIENLRWDNVQLLIDAGANLNFRDSHGNTPLMSAAGINQYHIVYAMLKAGADPAVKNNWGKTVLDRIKANNIDPKHELYQWRGKVIALLKERGMSVD
jgi:ankyrin repeat protein